MPQLVQPVSFNGLQIDIQTLKIRNLGSGVVGITLPKSFREKLEWFKGEFVELSLITDKNRPNKVLINRSHRKRTRERDKT